MLDLQPTRAGQAERERRGTYPATLLSLGIALPERRVSTEEIAHNLDLTEDWIVSRTGIRERRWAEPGQGTTDLAVAAGRAALARGATEATEVDLVLVATMTPDHVTPNTAPLVAHALGATKAGAWDVGAACTGWLGALSTATALVESGRAQKALVIGADRISVLTDRTDRRTAGLFADGAGAALVGPAPGGTAAIGPVILRTDGSHGETIICHHDERLLRMNGHETFKHAVARMTEVGLEAVAEAGLTLDDIDLVVPHQANGRIISAVADRLGLPAERVVDCIERLGNASAATIPVALAQAESEGRLRAGHRVLLTAFGAGFTWGGAVVEWGTPHA